MFQYSSRGGDQPAWVAALPPSPSAPHRDLATIYEYSIYLRTSQSRAGCSHERDDPAPSTDGGCRQGRARARADHNNSSWEERKRMMTGRSAQMPRFRTHSRHKNSTSLSTELAHDLPKLETNGTNSSSSGARLQAICTQYCGNRLMRRARTPLQPSRR